MLCGLGVPSLRSLWGAVRNRQLYILRMYCKGWISFNFSIFFIIYTTYSKKKKLHDLQQKKKNSIFFYNSHDLQQKKKNYTHLQQKKKNYTTIRFFCTRLTFFTAAPWKRLMALLIAFRRWFGGPAELEGLPLEMQDAVQHISTVQLGWKVPPPLCDSCKRMNRCRKLLGRRQGGSDSGTRLISGTRPISSVRF